VITSMVEYRDFPGRGETESNPSRRIRKQQRRQSGDTRMRSKDITRPRRARER